MDLDQALAAEQTVDRAIEGAGVGALGELVGERADQVAAVEVGVGGLQLGEGALELGGADRTRLAANGGMAGACRSSPG